MVRRGTALLMAILLMLVSAGAAADLNWKTETPAQQLLKDYIGNVNRFLADQGEQEINSLFEMYARFAEMGITEKPEAEQAEDVQIHVELYYDTLNRLELRMNDLERFPRIAAAFLWALAPESTSVSDALRIPADRADQALKQPAVSFQDEVEELNGTRSRVYYAYSPNKYRDGVNWMEMTIVFPLGGYGLDSGFVTEATETKGPDTWSDHDEEYEGYFSQDDYTHLEVFTTATPEPDSAAAEYDPYH